MSSTMISLRIAEADLTRIDACAKRAGMNRSAWMIAASSTLEYREAVELERLYDLLIIRLSQIACDFLPGRKPAQEEGEPVIKYLVSGWDGTYSTRDNVHALGTFRKKTDAKRAVEQWLATHAPKDRTAYARVEQIGSRDPSQHYFYRWKPDGEPVSRRAHEPPIGWKQTEIPIGWTL